MPVAIAAAAAAAAQHTPPFPQGTSVWLQR